MCFVIFTVLHTDQTLSPESGTTCCKNRVSGPDSAQTTLRSQREGRDCIKKKRQQRCLDGLLWKAALQDNWCCSDSETIPSSPTQPGPQPQALHPAVLSELPDCLVLCPEYLQVTWSQPRASLIFSVVLMRLVGHQTNQSAANLALSSCHTGFRTCQEDTWVFDM